MLPDPVAAMLDGVDWPLYALEGMANGYVAGAGGARGGTSVVRIDYTPPWVAQRLVVQTHRDEPADEVDLAHVAAQVHAVGDEGAPLQIRPSRVVTSWPVTTTIEIDGEFVPARMYDDGRTKVVVTDLPRGMVIVVGDSSPDEWRLVAVEDVHSVVRRRETVVAEYRERLGGRE